jgi:hypothetical protein
MPKPLVNVSKIWEWVHWMFILQYTQVYIHLDHDLSLGNHPIFSCKTRLMCGSPNLYSRAYLLRLSLMHRVLEFFMGHTQTML